MTQIELATDEDRDWQLDYWAKLFTADTWEEIQMIAKKSEYLAEASQMLYELNADDIERQKCRAREDYYRLQDMMQKEKEKVIREKEKLVRENKELRELRESFSAREKMLIEELDRMKEKLKQNGISV